MSDAITYNQFFQAAADGLTLGPDRHPKWQRVEPGTVIPAGQPYRLEFPDNGVTPDDLLASERVCTAHDREALQACWETFVDSSWKPPLVLPTTPGSVVEAMGPSGITRLWFLRSTGEWMNENGTITDADTNLDLYRVLFDAGAAR